MILTIIGYTIEIIFNFATGGFEFSQLRYDIRAKVLPVQILNIIISLLYFAYFESSVKQGTIGKQAMDIKVVDLDG